MPECLGGIASCCGCYGVLQCTISTSGVKEQVIIVHCLMLYVLTAEHNHSLMKIPCCAMYHDNNHSLLKIPCCAMYHDNKSPRDAHVPLEYPCFAVYNSSSCALLCCMPWCGAGRDHLYNVYTLYIRCTPITVHIVPLLLLCAVCAVFPLNRYFYPRTSSICTSIVRFDSSS